MSDAATIVVAWATLERVWDGKPFRADCGLGPSLVSRIVPHAVVWLLEGTTDDLVRAARYARQLLADDGVTKALATVYPVTEPDPLGRARLEILR